MNSARILLMDFSAALTNIYELVRAGGGFILPLFLSAIITGGIFLEQWWYSLLSGRRLKRLVLEPNSWEGVRGMDMISRMVGSLLMNREASSQAQKRDMELVYAHFERRIHWLSTLAAIAPMLGLVGTVAGMIRIFATVAQGDIKDPLASLSGGISEALCATGGGLIVAIFAALGYHYLNARHEALGQEMARWYETHQSHLRASR